MQMRNKFTLGRVSAEVHFRIAPDLSKVYISLGATEVWMEEVIGSEAIYAKGKYPRKWVTEKSDNGCQHKSWCFSCKI